MFACERCKDRMDIEVTSGEVDPGRCRRERQCPSCGYHCESTEVSDEAYHAAVEKRAMELAKKMVADTLEILGVHVRKTGTGDEPSDTPDSAVKQ